MLSTRKFGLRIMAAVGALLLPAFALSAAEPSPDDAPTPNLVQAWVGARIIDGTARPAIEKATLAIRNGHIEAVGTRVKVQAGRGRSDAWGKRILRELIGAQRYPNHDDRCRE